MNYEELSLDEILSLVNEKYDENEQQSCAFILVNEIYQDEIDDEEEFDAMDYLAEYFSYGEWREWLINTFLLE